MKIQIASDIHADIIKSNYWDIIEGRVLIPSAPVLVLAGDISEDKWRLSKCGKKFFEYLYDNWDYIIEVQGNHSVWGRRYEEGKPFFYDQNIEISPNKHWLVNNNMITIDDVNFYCSTLWSTIPKRKRASIEYCMNDYTQTFNFNATSSTDIFEHSQNWLFNALNTNCSDKSKDVVVTHHLPSFELIDNTYVGNKANTAYASSLDDSHLAKFPIDLWVHGHCHTFIDKMINGVRCVRNPLGYGYPYDKPCFINDFVIEV